MGLFVSSTGSFKHTATEVEQVFPPLQRGEQNAYLVDDNNPGTIPNH